MDEYDALIIRLQDFAAETQKDDDAALALTAVNAIAKLRLIASNYRKALEALERSKDG